MRRRTGSTDASVFATPPNHLPCPSTAQQPFPLVAVAVSAIASPPCLLSSPLYSRVCRGGEEYSATPPPPLACTSSTESIAPHLHSASPMESTLCSRTHTLPSAAWCYKAYSTMSSPCLTQFTPILHTPAHEPTRFAVPQKALPCTLGGCGCRSLAMECWAAPFLYFLFHWPRLVACSVHEGRVAGMLVHRGSRCLLVRRLLGLDHGRRELQRRV
jgi:hypothetical protein